MECGYVKIPCAGHDNPPTREQAQLFVDICSKFVAKNPLQCIGKLFNVYFFGVIIMNIKNWKLLFFY